MIALIQGAPQVVGFFLSVKEIITFNGLAKNIIHYLTLIQLCINANVYSFSTPRDTSRSAAT
jgi:hypothetical protein